METGAISHERLLAVGAWSAPVTIAQAEGVLMELLHITATEARVWLTSTAARRGQPIAELADEIVNRRSI